MQGSGMRRRNCFSTQNLVVAFFLLLSSYSALVCLAQTVQESVKTFIEEVRIPVTAMDGSGRFDPTVGIQDLMVREDGVVQQLRGLYRIPGSVLIILDTGGEQNQAK